MIQKQDKLSNVDSISRVAKSMTGYGLLCLPFAFKELGIFPAIIVTILISFFEINSVKFLLICKNITRK